MNQRCCFSTTRRIRFFLMSQSRYLYIYLLEQLPLVDSLMYNWEKLHIISDRQIDMEVIYL
jgi:hypothetical protein